MNFDDLLAALSSPLEALGSFDRERAIDAGIAPARAAEMARVQKAYFGPTRVSKQQRQAREAAMRGGFTLDQLVLVERRVAHLGASESMRLRRELLASHCSYEALKRRADKLVPPADPAPPTPQVRFSRPRNGRQTMTVTATDRDLADLEHHLRSRIDDTKPAAPQMIQPLLDLLRGESGEGVAPAAPRPLVLVPLPEYVKIRNGLGDDTVLGLSDGTTMTGADFLAQHFGAELEVALFHPQEGAVNLYRTQRFANQKQRDLAKAVMPVCAAPGCRHGADACETHHIQAWKHGGETNIANLVPLCRYHNGTNDDDADDAYDRGDGGDPANLGVPSPGVRRRSSRGRIVRRGGVPIWMSPRGHLVANDHAEFGAMTALFGR